MKKAPIKLSKETQKYFIKSLAKPNLGMEPALVWLCDISQTHNQTGKLLGAYEGPRVVLGWYKEGQRPRDSFYTLFGFSISIMPTTLEHIRHKTIKREKVEMIFENGLHYEYILKIDDSLTEGTDS